MGKNNEVYKTDYPENYKYYCTGYMGQTLASNSKENLKKALNSWPGKYKIKSNNRALY